MINNNNSTPINQGISDLSNLVFDFFNSAINYRFEQEIIESGLQVLIQLPTVKGASFIPFNEWQQNCPPLFFGEIPNQNIFSINSYLEQVELRRHCKNCSELTSEMGCTLLNSSNRSGIICRNIAVNDNKFGVINVYYDLDRTLTDQEIWFTGKISDGLGTLLEQIAIKRQQTLAFDFLTKNEAVSEILFDNISSLLESVKKNYGTKNVELVLPQEIMNEVLGSTNPITLSKTVNSWLDLLHQMDNNFRKDFIFHKFKSDGCEEISTWKCYPIHPTRITNQVPPLAFLCISIGDNTNRLEVEDDRLEHYRHLIGMMIEMRQNMIRESFQDLLAERIRLSREIHDGFAQTLAFLLIQFKRILRFYKENDEEKFLTAFEEGYQSLTEAYSDVRDSISHLRFVPEIDLNQNISRLLDEFSQKSKILVSQMVDLPVKPFSESTIYQLSMILQEGLTNIRRHSRATLVTIEGRNVGTQYFLKVRDNGVGFDENMRTQAFHGHIGIESMRERAELIGAKFEITSGSMEGTELKLIL